MPPSHPDSQLVDLLLRDHQSRMEEASTLRSTGFLIGQGPLPMLTLMGHLDSKESTATLHRRCGDAGKCSVALKLLESSTVSEVSQNVDIPHPQSGMQGNDPRKLVLRTPEGEGERKAQEGYSQTKVWKDCRTS